MHRLRFQISGKEYLIPPLIVVMQLMCGTSATFALGWGAVSYVSILISRNLGSISTLNGALYLIFFVKAFFALFLFKLLMFQPAELFLKAPLRYLLVVLCGSMVVLVGPSLTGKINVKPYFNSIQSPCVLKNISFMSSVMIVAHMLSNVFFADSFLVRLLAPAFAFLCLPMISYTAYIVTRTNRTRSRTWITWLMLTVYLAYGIFATSKYAMFLPPVSYCFAAYFYGYRFKFRELVIGGLLVSLASIILIPISDAGRNFVRINGKKDFGSFIKFLQDHLSTLDKAERFLTIYRNQTENLKGPSAFGVRPTILDRMSIVAVDDLLVARTFETGPIGLQYINKNVRWLPGLDKADMNITNYRGHWLGIINSQDLVTGVSVNFFSESFWMGSWLGVLILCPMLLFVYFIANNLLFGALPNNIWTICVFSASQHDFGELGLIGILTHLTRQLPIYFLYFSIFRFLSSRSGRTRVLKDNISTEEEIPLVGSHF